MKYIQLLPYAALAAAIVIPDAQVMQQLSIESHRQSAAPLSDRFPNKDELLKELENDLSETIDTSMNALDHAIDHTAQTGEAISKICHGAAAGVKSWVETATSTINKLGKHHGHHGHHHKPNLTIYELISKSNYTKKLAALVNEYDDLVNLLNSTSANFTVFAPIDKAFEKIPEHAPKPSKEELKDILLYHVSSDFYPAGKVLVTHTVPTLLEGKGIGGEKQRLSTNIGLKGLTVNFYSRIIAIDIFATNGVIHAVESILVPPPKAADVIDFLPGEFSTLELGLLKTGLFEPLNDTSTHVGGTIFAPSNYAFKKLGPKINAFLFSKYGVKYLKGLLKYHIVANKTLYSDAYYAADKGKLVEEEGVPKGFYHVSITFVNACVTMLTYLLDRSIYPRFLRTSH